MELAIRDRRAMGDVSIAYLDEYFAPSVWKYLHPMYGEPGLLLDGVPVEFSETENTCEIEEVVPIASFNHLASRNGLLWYVIWPNVVSGKDVVLSWRNIKYERSCTVEYVRFNLSHTADGESSCIGFLNDNWSDSFASFAVADGLLEPAWKPMESRDARFTSTKLRNTGYERNEWDEIEIDAGQLVQALELLDHIDSFADEDGNVCSPEVTSALKALESTERVKVYMHREHLCKFVEIEYPDPTEEDRERMTRMGRFEMDLEPWDCE